MLRITTQMQDARHPEYADTEVEMPMSMEDMMASDEGVDINPETGELVGGEEGSSTNLETLPFNANLAEYFPKEELDEIGATIKALVDTDKDTRKDWYDTLKQGFKTLGVYRADDTLESGLRRVSHPLLLEAATQFQARAMAELLPPGGPVKGAVIGEATKDILDQATRVEQFMNFQLTIQDRTYYDERDQMFFLLAFSGSEFDKQYFSKTKGKVVSRWVRSDRFIVPYSAVDLETAPHYTHEIVMSHNDYRRAVAAGVYTDAVKDSTDVPEQSDIDKEIKELGGQVETDEGDRDEDREHVFYETHIDFDLPGSHEEVALPYIITVDAVSGKVIGLYRNWKQSDPLRNKRIWFTHKKFLPGLGFYGFGLLHCIGNLGEAATEILRILLDSGAFATLQGGFKSRDCRMKGDVELEPGVWLDTEMTADELQKSFYTPPFKEPSQVLERLLGVLVAAGQKFAATTETMTGDAATTGPVGTMVAQIEQGSKVFSGIHKRLHKAFGDEFIHIAELNGENLPDVYPYRTNSTQGNVFRADFDSRIDIVPVSDPNIFSTAQRLAMAQTALQLTQGMVDISDRREAAINLLTAMRMPNPDRFFPKKQEAVRADPISEGAMAVRGIPIRAYLDQNHQAHLLVHQAQAMQMPPNMQPTMNAHIQEHMAMTHYMQFMMAGVPLPPMEWYPEQNQPMYPDLSPQIETQIAVAAARQQQQINAQQQAQQQAQQAQQQAQQSQRPDPQVQAQQEQQLKDAAFQRDQQRKDMAMAADVDRKDALSGLSPQMVKQADEFIKQTGAQMSPRELAVLSKALGLPFQAVVEAVSRMLMGGQGGSQFPQTAEMVNREPRFQ